MKKSIFMAGCVALLSLSMMFMGCSKNKNDENNSGNGGNGGGGGGTTSSGQYVVGETSYNITKAIYVLNTVDNETTIGFLSKGTVENPIDAISINFDNQNAIPVGTFNLDNENIDGEVMINGNEDTFDIETGTVTIAKSGNSYTITITNGAIEDNRNLTLNFTGTIEKIEIPEPPTPTDSYFTFGSSTYDIVFGAMTTEDIEGEMYTMVALLDALNENANLLSVAFKGATIPTGTFNFSLTNSNQMGLLQFSNDDNTYMLTAGKAVVQKSGNIYTIDITDGTAASVTNIMGSTTSVTCHFQGELLEDNKQFSLIHKSLSIISQK